MEPRNGILSNHMLDHIDSIEPDDPHILKSIIAKSFEEPYETREEDLDSYIVVFRTSYRDLTR